MSMMMLRLPVVVEWWLERERRTDVGRTEGMEEELRGKGDIGNFSWNPTALLDSLSSINICKCVCLPLASCSLLAFPHSETQAVSRAALSSYNHSQ